MRPRHNFFQLTLRVPPCQSTYQEVSANGLVSDCRKGCNQNAYFFKNFIKAFMKNSILVTLLPLA